jgi:hypothetical protein
LRGWVWVGWLAGPTGDRVGNLFIDLSKAAGPKFFINFEIEMRKSEDEETG